MRIVTLFVVLALAGCAPSGKTVRRDGAPEVRLSAKPSREAAACVAGNAKKLGMSSRIEQGAAPLDYIVSIAYQPAGYDHAAAMTDVKTYPDEGTSLRAYVSTFAPDAPNLGAKLLQGC